MILGFSVENMLSFNNETQLLLTPGKSQDHPHHIVNKFRARDVEVLKCGLIYGANASGKSNLVRAIDFMKKMVKDGFYKNIELDYRKFALDSEAKSRPSKIEMEFRYNNSYYAYGFSFNHLSILDEWLYYFNKEKDTKIFERTTSTKGLVSIDIEKLKLSKKLEERIKYIGQDTRPNQLFLNSINSRNTQDIKEIEPLREVFDWFNNCLTVIFPGTEFIGLEANTQSNNFKGLINYFLDKFDTGISDLKLESLDFFSQQVKLPIEVKEKLAFDLKSGTMAIIKDILGTRYSLSKSDKGKITANKIMTGHQLKNEKQKVFFDLNEESDGTQRMIDLIPSLAELNLENQVFVIDEIDRSLHPKLVKKYFEIFFKLTKNKKSQIIATTHQDYLLDLKSFRKDEFFMINKNLDGESELTSLEEFKIRKDLDIRSGYFDGRFHGVPNLGQIKIEEFSGNI